MFVLWLVVCWAIFDGGRVIGRAKMEGRNSYREVWYKFYGNLSVKSTGPQAGHVVLRLHLPLDLLHCGPVCTNVQMLQ